MYLGGNIAAWGFEMNEKVLSGVSNELLRLVEDFEIGSIPFAARDIEWLFYDDELKPFLQWIIQLFSSENILTPDEREQYVTFLFLT